MATSKYLQPVTLLAGILGLVQSITWFVLSLLGVLAYRCLLPVEDIPTNTVPDTIYRLYFESTECQTTKATNTDNNLIQPATLHGWMAAYLAFDIIWFFASVSLLRYYNRPKDWRTTYNLIRGWSLSALAFLIMDTWLTIEFALDYDELSGQVKGKPDASWIVTVPGAMMAVAARGFLLWFVNLSILIFFVSHIINWYKLCGPPAERYDQQYDNRVLNNPGYINNLAAYEGIPRPDPWLSDKMQPAILPVSQEQVRRLRPWENDAESRWVEHSAPLEPRVTKPQRPIAWEADPRLHRSYGPSASESRNIVREAAARQHHTERRQREGPLNFEDDTPRFSRNPLRSDFEHDLKNFEHGRPTRAQEQKKPFGQPVRVPQPPPLPRHEDSNYF